MDHLWSIGKVKLLESWQGDDKGDHDGQSNGGRKTLTTLVTEVYEIEMGEFGGERNSQVGLFLVSSEV